MPKIDTSTIQGYADMTPEQKISYFESFEFNDNASELGKLRESVKKLTGENADYKRKYQASLDEAGKKELADQEQKAQYEERLAKLAEYEKKEELLNSGFSAEECKILMEKNCSAAAYTEIFKKREEALKKSLGLEGIKKTTARDGLGATGNKDDEDDLGTRLAKKNLSNGEIQKIKDRYKI